ncbi:MAG: hypothetical protein WCR70_10335, partial [Sphaerochaetaceae bacterium]
MIEGQKVVFALRDNSIEISYPSTVASSLVYSILDSFAEKHGDLASRYAKLGLSVEPGLTVITTEKKISQADAASALSALIAEIDKLFTPEVTTTVKSSTAKEASIFQSVMIEGVKVDFTLKDKSIEIAYPDFVDIVDACLILERFAANNASLASKVGKTDVYVEQGKTLITTEMKIALADAQAALAALIVEIESFVAPTTATVYSDVVVEKSMLSQTVEIAGYDVTFTLSDNLIDVAYPDFVSSKKVMALLEEFAAENPGLAGKAGNVAVSFETGRASIITSEIVSATDAQMAMDAMIAKVKAYLTPASKVVVGDVVTEAQVVYHTVEIAGYDVTFAISDNLIEIKYPDTIASSNVNDILTAFAASQAGLVEKAGKISCEIGAGRAVIHTSNIIGLEDAQKALDAIMEIVKAYLTPASKVVVGDVVTEAQVVYHTVEIAGSDVEFALSDKSIEITYPAFVSKNDAYAVLLAFAKSNEALCAKADVASIEFSSGKTVISLNAPVELSDAQKAMDALVAQVKAYLTPASKVVVGEAVAEAQIVRQTVEIAGYDVTFALSDKLIEISYPEFVSSQSVLAILDSFAAKNAALAAKAGKVDVAVTAGKTQIITSADIQTADAQLAMTALIAEVEAYLTPSAEISISQLEEVAPVYSQEAVIAGQSFLFTLSGSTVEVSYQNAYAKDAVLGLLDAFAAANPELASKAGAVQVSVEDHRTLITASSPIALADAQKAMAALVEMIKASMVPSVSVVAKPVETEERTYEVLHASVAIQGYALEATAQQGCITLSYPAFVSNKQVLAILDSFVLANKDLVSKASVLLCTITPGSTVILLDKPVSAADAQQAFTILAALVNESLKASEKVQPVVETKPEPAVFQALSQSVDIAGVKVDFTLNEKSVEIAYPA